MTVVVEATEQSTTDDFDFTCPAGTNVLLLGYVRGRNNIGHPTATFNSVDMIRQRCWQFKGGQDHVAQWFWLPNPDTGADYAIDVTNLGVSYDALYAIALSGADPNNPFRVIEEYDGESSGDLGLVSNTITSSIVNDLVLDLFVQYRLGPPTKDTAGQTLIENDVSVGSSYKDGAASVEMAWDANSIGANIWIHSIISIRPDDSYIEQVGKVSAGTEESHTVTFNHTLVAGNNRMALVFGVVEEDDAGDWIGTFTYGGVNCTMIAGCEDTTQRTLNFGVGYVLETDLPTDGVKSVEVKNGSAVETSNLIGMAIVLENVMQEVPAVTEKAVDLASTISDSITTLSARSLIVSLMGGVNATRRVEFISDEVSIQGYKLFEGNGCLAIAFFEKLVAGAKTIQWDVDIGGDIGMGSFVLRPTQLAGGNPLAIGENF